MVIILAAGVGTVIQPALLTGGVAPVAGPARPGLLHAILLALAVFLAVSAIFMGHQLYAVTHEEQMRMSELSGPELYSEVARWRSRLHGRAAAELHTFLHTNLMLLAKVRQSLETLSNVILSDMGHAGDAAIKADLPNDTTFS
ncbi:hypothetical protein EVAR_46882_1 [Eumeta japonica]|uniref:Uncharacterized protein n=1 Tax=Eumeta variegata TaxID=151549 RepID=A0A4C1YG26_EUMVA|nr:hypothetical protein EVAR_46882_1 [Eumeta japonica]